MRKDIEIPEVEGVYVAAVYEQHPEYKTMDWNAYIINDRNDPLEMILIVSSGSNDKKITPAMRHSIKVLPAKYFAKIEFLQEKLLQLENKFAITFFADGKMYERTFVFNNGVIKESALTEIPIMNMKGILAV
ncbi:hypothetical protein BC962_0440 [Gillisia mitskevichiae]|uniref:Phenylalanyl-tRNA synthetase subunit alpha n=1 Tax=Gillisia mitskevichiae TaxID=270921 RepID=A0A495PXZ2_9FLAO|nr:hypothetical protein [Gillisia mitskevichiae]RKS55477.1 hypothetical protein BC962_0440 [Gillisia mitskevichiae]